MNDEKYLLNIKNFKKLNKIGHGTYGEVMTAQDITTKKIYAVKIFVNNMENSIELKTLLNQVSTLSNLSHRAIIRFYGVSAVDFYDENRPVLFAEYMRNGSIDDLIRQEKNGKSPPEWTFTKKLINIYGIASAMKCLHSHQILHRDLKPANVLLDDNFYPKLCDFDFSIKATDVVNGETNFGTVMFMAPEMYEVDTEKSFPIDVFSFAITVYRILTCEFNFFGDKSVITLFAYSRKICSGERPQFNTEIPESYRKLIIDCWSQDPSERPTFDEIVTRLKTDRGFITNEVDEEEFSYYIQYVEKKDDEKEQEQEETNEEIEITESKSNPFSIDVKNLNLKNFEKQDKIGQGYSCYVYKVKSKKSDIFYAAKIINKEINEDDRSTRAAQNLLREVNILSELSHPSIMKFYGYSSTDFNEFCRPVIVTELLSNGSLEDLIEIERNGFHAEFWNNTMKLINIYGIAKSMSYLHKKDIVHRDLKPINILSDDFLFPKLADFGFSKHLGDKCNLIENGIRLTQSGILGTVAFIAPEIWKNATYSKPGDVYAFGFLVYEMITLEIPFNGLDNNQVSYNVVCKKQRPKFKKQIQEHYKELIVKCWSQNPNERPTFDQIITMLETDQRFQTDIDKKIFNDYINYIKEREQENSIKNKKYSFQRYSLEEMYKEIKENKSELIGEGIVNIESYFNRSEIYRNDFSIFYEVSNKITGELYSAEISNIKIGQLNAKEKQDLTSEIEILTKLNHPAIQRIIGYSLYDFQHQTNPVIIRENMSNHTLYELLSNERKGIKNMKWTDTKKLINIYGIASGMSYLHSNDIIHHELNSQNVFVDSELNPKITQFGFMIKPQNSSRISNHSMISSTDKNKISYHIAPEVIECYEPENKKKEKASDVYSFAFIVYEIVTGKVPFENVKDQNQLFIDIISKMERPPLSGIPDKYSQIIERCWSADLEERPTFETIVECLRTDNKFITSEINEDEYRNYIAMIDQNK